MREIQIGACMHPDCTFLLLQTTQDAAAELLLPKPGAAAISAGTKATSDAISKAKASS